MIRAAFDRTVVNTGDAADIIVSLEKGVLNRNTADTSALGNLAENTDIILGRVFIIQTGDGLAVAVEVAGKTVTHGADGCPGTVTCHSGGYGLGVVGNIGSQLCAGSRILLHTAISAVDHCGKPVELARIIDQIR